MASAAARRSGALEAASATSTQVAPSCSYRRIHSCTCVETVGEHGGVAVRDKTRRCGQTGLSSA